MAEMTRRQWMTRSVAALAGLGAALGGGGVAQAYSLSVERVQAELPGLKKPLKAAFLTDLHYGLYMEEKSVERWVNVALKEKPDLILLGGDFIDTPAGTVPGALMQQLSRLQAPLGIYGVWGNHDYGSFGRYGSKRRGPARENWQENRQVMTEAMASAGITLLRNEAASPRSDLYLAGVDDFTWGEKPDLLRLLAPAGGRATLLLTHNPDLLPELPARVGLTLVGHTHGGQVRLPFIGAVVIPSIYGTRFDMGWKEGSYGSPAYVSRGLGCSGLPIRNLCPPEITVLDIVPAR